MNCYPLAYTGLSSNVGLFLIIAIGCLLLGTVMVLATRRRHRRARAAAALTVLSIAAVAFVMAPATPARASSSDCGTSATTNNSLTVRQTSTMDHLAPGHAPVPITGVVVNNSLDSTYITAVEVEITSVTTQSGSHPGGRCDASDYFLLNTRMLVQQPLGPGGSTPFTGASIGFRNKPTNQDACQHAVVHLLYTANPD